MSTFASVLKEKANARRENTQSKAIDDFVMLVHGKAALAADDGRFQIEIYDEQLTNSNFASAVKKRLKADGFKVSIEEDSHYSEHVNQTMMYLRLNWE